MPLLDHFHPPLIEHRAWEGFHATWASSISDALNQALPSGYFAEEEGHAGSSIEIDVATFASADAEDSHPENGARGGAALATAPSWVVPAPVATLPAVFADDFEIRVFSSRGGPKLVAAIEMVRPGNKDRLDTRAAFAVKCASYLHQSVAVVVIDIVTERRANLHHAILKQFSSNDAGQLPPGTDLYAAAYRPILRNQRAEIDVWAEPLTLGSPLPVLPLWLNAVTALRLDLESTYSEICVRRRIVA